MAARITSGSEEKIPLGSTKIFDGMERDETDEAISFVYSNLCLGFRFLSSQGSSKNADCDQEDH